MPRQEDFARALYTFDIGQNDLTRKTFFSMSLDEIRPVITDMVNNLASSLKVSTNKCLTIEIMYRETLINLSLFNFNCRVYITKNKEVGHFGYTIQGLLVACLTTLLWTIKIQHVMKLVVSSSTTILQQSSISNLKKN